MSSFRITDIAGSGFAGKGGSQENYVKRTKISEKSRNNPVHRDHEYVCAFVAGYVSAGGAYDGGLFSYDKGPCQFFARQVITVFVQSVD